MIVDKEKTIKKAIGRYNYLFPVRGKHSINECFFSLRGETFLIFRTKNQKIHKVKAETIRPPALNQPTGREVLDTIFKVINKPIIVRSLITKKPVRACLISLFPVPAITWSTNTVAVSDTSGTAELTHTSTNTPAVGPDGSCRPVHATAFPPADTRQYGFVSSEECTYSDLDCYIIRDTTICQYEILATGYLPICQFTDILPTPEEASLSSAAATCFNPGRWDAETNRFSEPGFSLPSDAATFHYEVLAPGYLHKRPRPEWKTISNRCVAGYVHERSPDMMNTGSIPVPAAARLHSDADFNQLTC